MARYECCGMKFNMGKELSVHLKGVHKVPAFNLDLSCCGVSFVESRQLEDHVRAEHHAQIVVQT